MLLTTTRCLPGFPLYYRTYHQETEPPYRRCERAHVLRLFRRGLVVGRWHATAANEAEAITAALGGRLVSCMEDGTLAPQFQRPDPRQEADTDAP